MRKKKIAVMVLGAVLLTGLLTGCGSGVSSSIDDKMEGFAKDRGSEDYSFQATRERLDYLMDHFTGAVYQTELILDEPREANYDDVIVEASHVCSEEELVQAFQNAYSNAATTLSVTFGDGYTTRLETQGDLTEVKRQVRRIDPLSASGIKEWRRKKTANGYQIYITYSGGRDELLRVREETRALVKEVAAQICAVATTDYEKIRELNRYLCENVTYPEEEPDENGQYPDRYYTPHHALKHNSAVCEGYAIAAAMIMEEMGLECDIPYGRTINDVPHAWNMVRINGKWYHIDFTWNGSDRSEQYLLVTDAYIRNSRVWKFSDFPKTPLFRY